MFIATSSGFDSYGKPFLYINKWFKSLTLSEKSVALTTVDKDLVNLFKAMYKKYSESGMAGKFTARMDTCDSSE